MRVFISYRRADDGLYLVRSLRDELAKVLGDENVFLDIESLPLGVDVRSHIRTSIDRADAVLVLIGKHWDEQRLFIDDDFVRMEILSAAELGKLIVPVLLDGRQMPSASSLPPELRFLRDRNAARIAGPPNEKADVVDLAARFDHMKMRETVPTSTAVEKPTAKTKSQQDEQRQAEGMVTVTTTATLETDSTVQSRTGPSSGTPSFESLDRRAPTQSHLPLTDLRRRDSALEPNTASANLAPKRSFAEHAAAIGYDDVGSAVLLYATREAAGVKWTSIATEISSADFRNVAELIPALALWSTTARALSNASVVRLRTDRGLARAVGVLAKDKSPDSKLTFDEAIQVARQATRFKNASTVAAKVFGSSLVIGLIATAVAGAVDRDLPKTWRFLYLPLILALIPTDTYLVARLFTRSRLMRGSTFKMLAVAGPLTAVLLHWYR